jgi:ATP-dependent protease ClpP protease subunit
MTKEILLYNDIYSYTASEFVSSLNDALDSDIVVRIATDGGDPQYVFGMVAKFAEHPKNKQIKVDGKAYSGGSFFCLYSDNVEALNVSQFLFHRAAYPDWFEKEPKLFTDAIKEELVKVNANLRAAFEAKIDVEAFQKLKKVSVDDLFSMEKRIDVFLTAKEAKKIGLIDTIVDITPKKKAEIQSRMKMAAKHSAPASQTELDLDLTIKKDMTLIEFKAAHPEIFAQAVTEGVNQERDRVGSWLPYMAADPTLVTASIKEGKTITATAMSELNVKMFAANSLAALAAANAGAVVTPEVELAAKGSDAAKAAEAEKKLAFRNEARVSLGLPALK